MLSPEYFDFRWSWYNPIFNRGETTAGRCRVDVRRLPIRFSGEDGKEYIPYAVNAAISQGMQLSIRRLKDYSVRYIIKGEKVSSHQLPVITPVARSLIAHLRQRYPHFPQILLHHWCADEKGGLALLQIWQAMWEQSWKQDREDNAPWIASVNILILKLVRQAIAQLSHEYGEHTDHVLVCIVGGLYQWALRNFLNKHLEGAVEVTRISTYESMMIPATPIAFLYRQPDDSLLGDDRFVIMSYGLEPDIVPRLRDLRAKVGSKHEAGILALLAQDRMGEHMLKRTWARLALWELAEKSGQGIWMQWVLDAKKLDQFLARPELLSETVVKLLEAHTEYPLVAWILALRNPKKVKLAVAAKPWLKDDRVLNAFRVFEEDVIVERTRRKAETVWLDQRRALLGVNRGKDVETALSAAWKDGKLIYFQGADKSLHSGASLSSTQACLRVEWSDYLASMYAVHMDYEHFLHDKFLPLLLAEMTSRDDVFLDGIQASGCMLRGAPSALVSLGEALQDLLRQFYLDAVETDGRGRMPSISMCMTMMGDWVVVDYKHKALADIRLASGLAVAQADAGVSHDAGLAQMIAWRDHQAKRKALGGVRVEILEYSKSQTTAMLCNQGFALTEAALTEYLSTIRAKARIKKFYLDQSKQASLFAAYRIPNNELELVAVVPYAEGELIHLFAKAGSPHLNGGAVNVYELLDASSEAAEFIRTEILATWMGG